LSKGKHAKAERVTGEAIRINLRPDISGIRHLLKLLKLKRTFAAHSEIVDAA
jgi:hypothetical protein